MINSVGLGTKNRQKQTADICKEHLRTTYPAQLVLVEDFIKEIEGHPADVSKSGQFTDLSRNITPDKKPTPLIGGKIKA
jgi:hypothetical protein